MLLIVHFLITLVSISNQPNYEQLAADHFFKNIVDEKYPKLKVTEFATKTDTSINPGIVMTCNQWDERTRKNINSQVPEEQGVLRVPASKVQVKRIRRGSDRLKVFISPRRKIGEYYFEIVQAYSNQRFVDFYFYQFDRTGQLIDICVKNEIM